MFRLLVSTCCGTPRQRACWEQVHRPKAVQSILGHQSAAFTLTFYGQMLNADLDDLAARLDNVPRPSRGLAPHGTVLEEASWQPLTCTYRWWAARDSNPARRIKSPELYQMS
jgi:hypothetical protein